MFHKVNLSSLKPHGHIRSNHVSQIGHSSQSLVKQTNKQTKNIISNGVLLQGEQILTELMQVSMMAVEVYSLRLFEFQRVHSGREKS